MNVEYVGILASILSFIPFAYIVYSLVHKQYNLNILILVIGVIGYCLWLYYSIKKKTIARMVTSSLFIVAYIFLIIHGLLKKS
jgi:heme/copper-type cytochrome/quinol oxidase subunit 4